MTEPLLRKVDVESRELDPYISFLFLFLFLFIFPQTEYNQAMLLLLSVEGLKAHCNQYVTGDTTARPMRFYEN